jgi:hypothetical protein
MFFFDDFLFYELNYLDVEVTETDIVLFIDNLLNNEYPNEFIIDVVEFKFKVNKEKRQFRIVERNYNGNNVRQVDFAVCRALKIASYSDFEIFLDPKYCN